MTKLFPPDTGVSTLRMRFFYEKLTGVGHVVDVLKLGDSTNFNDKIKTINKSLFGSFFSTVLRRQAIKRCVSSLISEYDLVIVSATPYGLYEVAHAAKCAGVPYILDLRDLPDLTTSEQKGSKPFFWLFTKSWLINLYIKHIARNSLAVFCVGVISTAITQFKLRNIHVRVVNVHNGFNSNDLHLVRDHVVNARLNMQEGLTICCVGNIFKFRDTLDLRDALKQLSARNEMVTLLHWGKVSDGLFNYIGTLPGIVYVSCKPVPREQLLRELHNADGFLLPCADDLIWEPTTSVFDYILFDKPVIFTGLRNNEAYLILENSRTEILKADQLKHFELRVNTVNLKSDSLLFSYRREFYLDRVLHVINQVKSRK